VAFFVFACLNIELDGLEWKTTGLLKRALSIKVDSIIPG